MIELDNITRSFGSLQVLKGISLNINRGEVVSITGPSGAGKTTLLQIMGSLDKPDGGKVLYDGQDITRMSEKEISAFRNKHIGFVFQFHQLGIYRTGEHNHTHADWGAGHAPGQCKSQGTAAVAGTG